MKSLKLILFSVASLSVQHVFGQWKFKVTENYSFYVAKDNDPHALMKKCNARDSGLDFLFHFPSAGSVYEVDLINKVFLTDGVITSNILDIYTENDYLLFIKFKRVDIELQGFITLKKEKDGSIIYTGCFEDPKLPDFSQCEGVYSTITMVE